MPTLPPEPNARRAQSLANKVLRSQELGLIVVLLVLGTALTLAAGSHADPLSGQTVNNFLNR